MQPYCELHAKTACSPQITVELQEGGEKTLFYILVQPRVHIHIFPAPSCPL